MEPKTEISKMPEMVMCGDHPSFTKTELNAKEPVEEKEVPDAPCIKLASTSSHSQKPERGRHARGSGHALRPRRGERPPAPAAALVPGNALAGANAHTGALVQAALGSFRWPPYLLTVWVLVLVLTHALHCLVGCLERALPRLRNFCQYLRSAAERSWRSEPATRAGPAALVAVTCIFYAVYYALYVAYSIALWAIEPLAAEEKPEEDVVEAKVTDYEEEARSDHSLK